MSTEIRIPDELINTPQWICYNLITKDGRETKFPVSPKTGEGASSTNPEDWCDYYRSALYKINNKTKGLGFVLSEQDNFICIDLDHCIDEEGKPLPYAQKIIDNFDTYIEYSQSGKGLHIFLKGSKPGSRSRTKKDGHEIEIYQSKRFIAMTNKALKQGPVKDCQEALNNLYNEYFKEEEKPEYYRASPTLSEQEILSLIEKSQNGDKVMKLMRGDFSDFPSQSEADASLMHHLAFWCNKDRTLMDSLFRKSGLYREKYERGDYRELLLSEAINRTVETYTPPTIETKKPKKKWKIPNITRELTDSGNAEMFKRAHPDDILYNKDANIWLIWDGKCFSEDKSGKIFKVAQKVIDKALSKLEFMDLDPKLKAEATKFFTSSKNLERLKKMLELAKSEEGITVEQKALNPHKDLLNVKNGVIKLRDGKLLPHDKKYLMSKIIDIEYNYNDCFEDDTRGEFMRFINSISCKDHQLIYYHQVLCGYFLTGETTEQSLYFYIGKGSTGKSTLANMLRLVMGPYCKDAPQSAFLDKNDTSNFELAYISDARLVISSEESEKSKFNEPLIKRLSGSEELACCHKYGNFFRIKPEFKLLTTTNEIPYIASQGFDMKRRIKALPFNQRFTEGDPEFPLDKQLDEKLRKEAPGILAWMVAGAVHFYDFGFPKCQIVDETIEDIFADQDILRDWLLTHFDFDPKEFTLLKDLWSSYCQYCQNTDTKKTFNNSRGLAKNLDKRDEFIKFRKTNGTGYFGLKKKEVIYLNDDYED